MAEIFPGIGLLDWMNRNLQSMIQVFIRIIFRSIGQQEKHRNFDLVVFRSGRSMLAMMDLQIVQDQEHLLLWNANQALHKPDQPLLVHSVLIDHKPDFALTADCGEHIDPLPLRFHWQHGRTAFQGKAALYDFTVAYARLIRPIDDGILCFCTS